MRRFLERCAQPVIVGLLPVLVITVGVGRYIFNHFFAHAPYLLDTGLLSGITYRSGLLIRAPQIACNYADSFYEVYFSPIISVFSGLSYLQPLPRMEWFAIVQAFMYLPLGLAVYLVASRFDLPSALKRMPLTLAAALAFTTSGMVIWTIGYPHYEVATSAFACLTLACVLTQRTRWTWVCLALAASIRQDGGFHVAMALTPLLYLSWRGVSLPVTRRRIWLVFGVAVGSSVAAFLLQKLFFVPVDRLRDVYLGRPMYSHVTAELMRARVDGFLTHCKVIYYPFLATILVAILRRDVGYLFGWFATLPWFAFNFFANDHQKAMFTAYALSPFIVSMFWAYLHGAFVAKPARRLRAGVLELLFALICISSTLGLKRSNSAAYDAITRDMLHSLPRNRPQIYGFVDAVRRHHARFLRVGVDNAVATLGLDVFQLEENWHPGRQNLDTLMFHTESPDGVMMLADLVLNDLSHCITILGTKIVVCSRYPIAGDIFAHVRHRSMPSTFLYTPLGGKSLRATPKGVAVAPHIVVHHSLGGLNEGDYEWRLSVEPDAQLPVEAKELGRVEVVVDGVNIPAEIALDTRDVIVRFSVTKPRTDVRYVVASSAPFVISDAQLRRVTHPAPR